MDIRDINKVFHPTAEYIVHMEHFLDQPQIKSQQTEKDEKSNQVYFSITMVQNLKSIIGETVENSQIHANLTTNFCTTNESKEKKLKRK